MDPAGPLGMAAREFKQFIGFLAPRFLGVLVTHDNSLSQPFVVCVLFTPVVRFAYNILCIPELLFLLAAFLMK